ncbi:MAG: polymer-forming cytoskeletal protein, partial [Verrucomicrobiales bacterium]
VRFASANAWGENPAVTRGTEPAAAPSQRNGSATPSGFPEGITNTNGSSRIAVSPPEEPTAAQIGNMRTAVCFQCGHTHTLSKSASSSICPSCSSYISLRDVDVRNDSRQKIKTRGDVVVHREASLCGSTLSCHNLKVLGEMTGSANCSGDASFASRCKMLGIFSCKTLTIDKKGDVVFLQPVYVEDLVIAGKVRGDFYCVGTVTIGKNGSLDGEVLAQSLSIQPGGILNASARISRSGNQVAEEFRARQGHSKPSPSASPRKESGLHPGWVGGEAPSAA